MLSTVVESKKKWDTKKADKMETDRSTMSQQKRSHVRKTEDSTTWCTDIREYTWFLTKSEQYARNAWPDWRPGAFWEAGAFWFDAAGEFECVTWFKAGAIHGAGIFRYDLGLLKRVQGVRCLRAEFDETKFSCLLLSKWKVCQEGRSQSLISSTSESSKSVWMDPAHHPSLFNGYLWIIASEITQLPSL